MCHLGVSQLIIVYQIQSSVRDGWVKFKVSDSQTIRRGNWSVCYHFYSEIYGLQKQMGVTDFSKMQGQRANKVCTIEPGGVFEGEV